VTPYVLQDLDHREAFLTAHRDVCRLVELAPDVDAEGRATRCHEVARAARLVLCEVIATWPIGVRVGVTVVDGTYLRAFEHSWIGLQIGSESAVLDAYAVGRFPPVQLVTTSMGLHREYRPDPLGFPRDDIREQHVEQLCQRWRDQP
jgi:hypothetical protein